MITREEAYKKAIEQKKQAQKDKKRQYNMLLNSAYTSNPRLSEIDREHAAVGANLVNAALSGGNSLGDLKKHSAALTLEKKLILEKTGVKEPTPDCSLCGDTGYVGGKICDCVKRKAAEIMLSELSAEMPIESSRFDNLISTIIRTGTEKSAIPAAE